MNAMNFIDGLDGLVAGRRPHRERRVLPLHLPAACRQTSPLELLQPASLLAIVLVGACAGFLPLNWHPAKLFMGDAGALLIGLLMATLRHRGHGPDRPGLTRASGEQFLARSSRSCCRSRCSCIPLLDFGLAVVRRLRAGKSPFAADRKHLHHRLLDMGHSHLHAVLIFYAWTAVRRSDASSRSCSRSYLGIASGWAFLLLGLGFIVCAAITLAPLGRRKRLTVAAEAEPVDGPRRRVRRARAGRRSPFRRRG